MQTFKPMNKEEFIVKMNRQQLEDALNALDDSGADEIGIPIEKQ